MLCGLLYLNTNLLPIEAVTVLYMTFKAQPFDSPIVIISGPAEEEDDGEGDDEDEEDDEDDEVELGDGDIVILEVTEPVLFEVV